MRELNVNEIKEVNGGGALRFLGEYLAGKTIDAVIGSWKGSSGTTNAYDDYRLAP